MANILRHLLGGKFVSSIAAALSRLSPSWGIAADSAAMPPAYNVIVVGAGMAGITAAKELQSHHLRVAVVEARDRVGGRIWAKTLSDGSVVDLGVSWLHNARKNPLYSIVKDLGIETFKIDYDQRVI